MGCDQSRERGQRGEREVVVFLFFCPRTLFFSEPLRVLVALRLVAQRVRSSLPYSSVQPSCCGLLATCRLSHDECGLFPNVRRHVRRARSRRPSRVLAAVSHQAIGVEEIHACHLLTHLGNTRQSPLSTAASTKLKRDATFFTPTWPTFHCSC